MLFGQISILGLCLIFMGCDLIPENAADSPDPLIEGSGSTSVRQPKDLVGYTHSAEGIARVVKWAMEAEADRLGDDEEKLSLGKDGLFVAGISPHDDYQYAQQVYVHLYPWLKARHVILIGVAHGARNFPETEGRLVFDAFDAWHGPYKEVPISCLRADLLAGLDEKDALVNNELQISEHSLEGMIPFLQHFNRDVEIVPVLVPYMSLERLLDLAEKTGSTLSESMKRRGLSLGRDVAILISSDSVHYGDRGWGGKCFADFGVDGKGYDQAVARDHSIIDQSLIGPISLDGMQRFYSDVVAEDFHEYKVTWCGRFSIPFGLSLLIRLSKNLGSETPEGSLLRYGTTLDPGRHDPGVPGLGVTAEANLHHWVGFVSIGYR
ncbi:MAG: AmmeMemoRadiSam system protein B [Planctomycetes bacterium]|nr:AmmeMemoRadiSam system protein B [Planctomycetota bacterium]